MKSTNLNINNQEEKQKFFIELPNYYESVYKSKYPNI